MDTVRKVYCCIPIKFKDDEKIHYELETVKNYYLANNPQMKDVEFVSNYVEDGQSRNYALDEQSFKNAAIDELAKAIERLKDCSVVVFYPDCEADDACKAIKHLCDSYQYKTRVILMSGR